MTTPELTDDKEDTAPKVPAAPRVSVVHIAPGDCLDTMLRLAQDGVLVDSVVTDPPYHLTSIVKRFGGENAAPAKHGTDGAYARASAGFMGKVWDGGDVAFRPETWRLVFDLMKPGAHLVAFGGTRTYHRMACAIEDAGFEIRDQLGWLYGSGFPKSHDVGKGIDREAGAIRRVIGPSPFNSRKPNGSAGVNSVGLSASSGAVLTAAATEDAALWEGWGTALKPAWEPIVLARKPLSEKTVAANVLRWGTGAINIDACRVTSQGETTERHNKAEMSYHGGNLSEEYTTGSTLGRWPANVVHDGSDEVLAAFPQSSTTGKRTAGSRTRDVPGTAWGNTNHESIEHTDSGSAARFYYAAKASKKEREGSKHPTVKPVALIRWLARLVTPPGGLILDPFAGSGTLGVAALAEGFSCILCERETAYLADIAERVARARSRAERSE